MYELVLALSLATSACDIPTPPSTTQVVYINRPNGERCYRNWDGGIVCQGFEAPPHCAERWETTYLPIDSFRSYKACMRRVARVGEQDNLKAICRRVR